MSEIKFLQEQHYLQQLSREFIRDYDASPDVKATYYCHSLDEAKQLVQR